MQFLSWLFLSVDRVGQVFRQRENHGAQSRIFNACVNRTPPSLSTHSGRDSPFITYILAHYMTEINYFDHFNIIVLYQSTFQL